ncbi:beta-galactosidase [Actinotalea sp. K2]|uniref:beta-galactosidase n=1 Tax=Actinotalea sp. K2 TaxID=2939438 RepID=UPI0020176011|nr:beta-galactosidase [Actinotalea sp. K2]MCL3861698.1 beta-galactosidase [Actinotalea sp. K2]
MPSDASRTPPRPAPRRLRVTAPPVPLRDHLPLGEPAGTADRLEVTSRWVERDGRPWFPVSGEVHYSRVPRDRWSEVLGHARAGGLDSVAAYVLWRAHEPEPGDFRWDGNLDLRAFVELAASHGLDVVVRMGPWAHGEARHGGFPDWLVERRLDTRTDDPAYLELVRAFFAATVTQLSGLGHAEGGPVVAAQMDNELYDQPGHLATLREIAEDLGLRVPLWTATGWGGAKVPRTLLPVYGAYADGFWEDSLTPWPRFAATHFRYDAVRDDLSVGADVREVLDGHVVLDGNVVLDGPGADPGTGPLDDDLVPLADDDVVPFATCELGGGMHVAYHRRPLVTPQDVAALTLAKIGSGSVWQGYYMYAGGTQRTAVRAGQVGGEQESHATGYPNDVPELTYDFHAPIGEHGQIRPHHHLLRRQHLWLAAEGERLATMTSTTGGGSEHPDDLRWAVRGDGRSGYLFLTTYQPARQPLAAQHGVQVTVAFDDDVEVRVPTVPVDVPAGVSVAWPLRYALTPGLVLRSATAQVLTRLAVADHEVVVLVATAGVPVELVLEGDVGVTGAGHGEHRDGATVVHLRAAPGPGCVVDLPGVRIMVLDEAAADRLYRLEVGGRDRLVLSDAPLYVQDGALVVHTDSEQVTVSLLPAPAGLRAFGGQAGPPRDEAPWHSWSLDVPAAGHRSLLDGPRALDATAPEPVHGGPMDRLSTPTDWSGAAQVRLDVPREMLDGVDRVLLRVRWRGDVGRAYVGDRMISDHFWHGRPWDLDLTPLRDEVVEQGVRLELLPWDGDAGVWVDPTVRGIQDGVVVDDVEVVRVARVRLELEEAEPWG